MSLQIKFLLTTCFKNIMFNEKNKLRNTNNRIPKMLDKLKHVDNWRHLWRPFWILFNANIVRRTPGSDSAPPNYQNRMVGDFSAKMPPGRYLWTFSCLPTSPPRDLSHHDRIKLVHRRRRAHLYRHR